MLFKKIKFSLKNAIKKKSQSNDVIGHSKFNYKLIPEKRLVREEDGEFYLATKYIRPDKDIQSILDKYPKLKNKYKEYLTKYNYSVYDNFHNLQYILKISDNLNNLYSLNKEIKIHNSILSKILKSDEYNKDLLKTIIGLSVLFTGLKGVFPELRGRHLGNLLNNENFLNELRIRKLEVRHLENYSIDLFTILMYKGIEFSRHLKINYKNNEINLYNTSIHSYINKPISIENMLFYQVSLMELLKDIYNLDNFKIKSVAQTSLDDEFIGGGIWLRKGYSLSDITELVRVYINLSLLEITNNRDLSDLFKNFNEFVDLINEVGTMLNIKREFSAKDNFELFNKLINFDFEFYDNKDNKDDFFTFFHNLINYNGSDIFINRMKNILSIMKDRAFNENKIRLFDILKFIENGYSIYINDKNEFILNLLAREKL